MTRGGWLLVLLGCALPVHADDTPPAAAAPKLRTDPGPAADAASAALASGDEAALAALAAQDDPDPWLVADELLRRGARDAALAFARAAPRPDTEALPSYVEAWRAPADDVERRDLLARLGAAWVAQRLEEVAALLGDVKPQEPPDVVTVRFGTARSSAFRQIEQSVRDAARATHATGESAERLGWLARAAENFERAAGLGKVAPDVELAVEALERAQSLAERRRLPSRAALLLGELASAHRLQGNLVKARKFNERALAAFESLGDRLNAARILGNLGNVLSDLGEHARALDCQQRALAVKEELGDKRGAAATQGSIGSVYMDQGDLARAREALQRALAIQESLGDRSGAAQTMGDLGIVRKDLGDYAEAQALLERALAIQRELGDTLAAARTSGNLGNLQRRRGEYARAVETLTAVLQTYEQAGRKGAAASALSNLGRVYADMGDHARAVETLERGRLAMEALGDRSGAARALAAAGDSWGELGEPVKALQALQQAQAVQEALGERMSATSTLELIGLHHMRQGEMTKALAIFERALAAARADGRKTGIAASLGNIAGTHHSLGDYAKALTLAEEALALNESLGSRQNVATLLGTLGGVHGSLGDASRSSSFFERSRAAFEAMGDLDGAASALGNLASVQADLGDLAASLVLYERALAAREALGDKAGAASARSATASLTRRLGNPAAALPMFQEVLATREALGDRKGLIRTLQGLADALWQVGRRAEAREALERSVRMARSLRLTPDLVFGLRRLAEYHLRDGDSGRALGRAREALTEVERLLGGLGEEEGAGARAWQGRLFEVGTLAAAQEQDAAESLAFLESGRAGALLDALGKREQLRWKAESIPEALHAAEVSAQAAQQRARLAYDRVLAASPQDRRQVAEAARVLDDAFEELRAVNARIQRETKRAAGLFYPRATTLEELQGALEPGDAFVLYGLCLEDALALVVGPEDARIVPLGPRSETEAACAALDLTDSGVDPSVALAGLRRRLIEPLGLGPDVRRVFVSPEGPLGYLPFGALLDVPVVLTPSGTTHVLLREEDVPPGEGVLALGDPDYAGLSEGAKAVYVRRRVLQPLPATRAEAENVGTVVLLGGKASEEGLREALSRKPRWRALHLACHGIVDAARPSLSALALARAGDQDGFLTALEVGRMRIPADLAVLSACETGRGKVVRGEGIVGLTRAFMYAGTPRVLCSLWKVDDAATAALMTEFYRLWLGKDGTPGLPAAQALRQAQAFVRAQEQWKHPYYWAAWVLWGLP